MRVQPAHFAIKGDRAGYVEPGVHPVQGMRRGRRRVEVGLQDETRHLGLVGRAPDVQRVHPSFSFWIGSRVHVQVVGASENLLDQLVHVFSHPLRPSWGQVLDLPLSYCRQAQGESKTRPYI